MIATAERVLEQPSEARISAKSVSAEVARSPAARMSFEEFLEWAPESRIAEWVDGEVIMPSPPKFGHQDISDFLAATLRIFVQAFQLGQVISAPFLVRPRPDLPGREPDLLFIATPRALNDQTARLEEAPDLVVEVISRESVGRDRGDKYVEYAEAGVQEYWLINGLQKQAEFYQLNELGLYDLAFAGHGGVYVSQVIQGFALPVEWLWQTPRPRPELAVLEIAGPAYARQILQASASVLPAGEIFEALVALSRQLSPEDRERLRVALS